MSTKKRRRRMGVPLPSDIIFVKSQYGLKELSRNLGTRLPKHERISVNPYSVNEEEANDFKVLFRRRTKWRIDSSGFWSPSVEWAGNDPEIYEVESMFGSNGEEGVIARMRLKKPCILYIHGITDEGAGTYLMNGKAHGRFPPAIQFAVIHQYV
jgi:hypothetical protein